MGSSRKSEISAEQVQEQKKGYMTVCGSLPFDGIRLVETKFIDGTMPVNRKKPANIPGYLEDPDGILEIAQAAYLLQNELLLMDKQDRKFPSAPARAPIETFHIEWCEPATEAERETAVNPEGKQIIRRIPCSQIELLKEHANLFDPAHKLSTLGKYKKDAAANYRDAEKARVAKLDLGEELALRG